MLAAALSIVLIGQTPVRPRDPWAFRAVFEDRPRQLVIGLGSLGKEPPLWMVFHPETGAARKVWRGQVDYRGKVFDFSQENSRAMGTVLAEAPNLLLRLPEDGALPDGWEISGVRRDQGWRFETDNAVIRSPFFDVSGWQKTYVAFDEFGDKGRLRFKLVSRAGTTLEEFQSSSTVLGPTAWQWNYRLIQKHVEPFRLVVEQAAPRLGKRLRNLRVFGDFPSWRFERAQSVVPALVRFVGYRIDRKGGLTVSLRVGDASIDWQPELTSGGWTEEFHVAGMPGSAGLSLRRSSAEGEFDANPEPAENRTNAGTVRFAADGSYRFRFAG